MLQFLLGTAVLLLPVQTSVPLLGVLTTVQAGKTVACAGRRRRGKRSAATRLGAAAKAKDAAAAAASSDLVVQKIEPVTLEWSGVSCTLEPKKGPPKQILSDVAGAARPGRLLAIMGPSGSGKTSLISSLAGQLPQNKKLHLRGAITVNGAPASSAGHRQGYVQQQDEFYSMLTVDETLDIATQLQLPQSLSQAEKEQYKARLVNVLGLAKVVDSVVGDAKSRGISGGEKKRLSVGCELISSPSLLFADEPTTGLDSFQAEKVVSTLKQLAEAGHTVVTSIHQPRTSIYNMFDDLLLLSEGRVIYAGPASDALVYFEAQGFKCPEHYNPAEFVADLVSIDFTSPEAEAASRERVRNLAEAHATAVGSAGTPASRGSDKPTASTSDAEAGAGDDGTEAESTCGWRRQFALLMGRSWKQISRDRATNVARLGSNISSAAIFGAIFWRMARKQSSIQDRLGLLQVCAINTAMSSLIKTLNVFPRERVIVNRERAKGSYKILPYLTGKLAAELPIGAAFPLVFGAMVYPLTGLNKSPIRFARFLAILTLESFASSALGLAVGAAAPSTEAALALGPAVMLVWIVFGGLYVNADNVPGPLKALPKASLIKQAFQALCINEFEGLEFDADDSGNGMRTGEKVLQWLSFDKATVGKGCAAQARILLFYYWLTYNILKTSKPRFQPLRAAEEADAGGNNRAQIAEEQQAAAQA